MYRCPDSCQEIRLKEVQVSQTYPWDCSLCLQLMYIWCGVCCYRVAKLTSNENNFSFNFDLNNNHSWRSLLIVKRSNLARGIRRWAVFEGAKILHKLGGVQVNSTINRGGYRHEYYLKLVMGNSGQMWLLLVAICTRLQPPIQWPRSWGTFCSFHSTF